MRLILRNVSKSYGQRTILNSISMDLPLSTCLALVGPSGLGKSTLLEVAAGMISPDQGQVIRNGRVALALQDDGLLPWCNAARNLAYVLSRHAASDSIAHSWLNRMDLDPSAMPGQMSGGMRRRLGLARAFAIQAEIILLDEPFAFLDTAWQRTVAEMIDEAVGQGAAVLFSTHQTETLPRSVQARISLSTDGNLFTTTQS